MKSCHHKRETKREATHGALTIKEEKCSCCGTFRRVSLIGNVGSASYYRWEHSARPYRTASLTLKAEATVTAYPGQQ